MTAAIVTGLVALVVGVSIGYFIGWLARDFDGAAFGGR